MNTSSMALRVIIILAFAVLGASAGVCWQALHITGKPQAFRSMAKVVSARGMLPDKGDDATALADHYGTIIETLESAEMKRRTLERVRALNPDLKEIDVAIRVVQSKGSAIFNVLASGNEPKYTRIYLDALLDEFMAFRQQLLERFGKAGGSSDVAIQERATPASENVEDWRIPIAVGALGGGLLSGMLGLLLSLIIVHPAPLPLPPSP